MAKKMVLVPADLAVERFPPLPPYQRQMNVLDSEMRSILDNKTLPSEMKMKLFYNTLRQYGLVEQNATNPDYVYRPPAVPVTPEPGAPLEPAAAVPVPPDAPIPVPAVETEKQLPASDAEILQQVPAYSRKNTKLLLNYLKRNPDISWNQDKEMVYKGTRIPLSNLYDLVVDISRDRKKQDPAIGWKVFASSLMKQNIPQSAIGNKQRWKYMMIKEGGIPDKDLPITHDLRSRKVVAGRRKHSSREPITPPSWVTEFKR